jgi:hypothetical protein
MNFEAWFPESEGGFLSISLQSGAAILGNNLLPDTQPM